MDRRTRPLHVLMVEDSPADAELILRAMRELGVPIEHRRVSSEAALRDALAERLPDIILSDFSMPGFSGQDALRIAKEVTPHTPFLFVSGTIGEELAIEALRRGADDYVLKDNLRRLPSAMDRAIRAANERAERVRMARALQDSEERFRSIVESSLDWIWEVDANGRIVYSNEAVRDILGLEARDITGTSMFDLLCEDSRKTVEALIPHDQAGSNHWQRRVLHFHHKDGSVRVLISNARSIHDGAGNVTGFRGAHHDDTERIAQEAKIRQLVRIHAVLGAFGTQVLHASSQQQLLDRACEIAVKQGGFVAAGIGIHCEDDLLRVVARCGDPDVLRVVAPTEPLPIHAPDSPYHAHPGIRALREKRKIAVHDFTDADVPAQLRDQMRAIGVCSEIALPIGPEPWGLLALFSDTVQRQDDEEAELLQRLADDIARASDFIQQSERLEYLAYHNPVTGLPNRAEFRERLPDLLRGAGTLVVAVGDIHGFGRINDSRGRSYGDTLLRLIGQAFAGVAEGAFVAHPESDTFVVAYAGAPGGDADTEASRFDAFLHTLGQRAFVVDDETVYVAVSAGIALAPAHGDDGESLERNALAALAEAKKRRVRVLPFTEALRGRAARRLELERDLRRAIEAHEFTLHYQPKFSAATQRLLGAEALLRWTRPDGAMVSPADFIPVLEETGLIVPVGRWVLRRALATAMRWREKFPGIRIAVNLSARELRAADFSEAYAAMLGPHASEQPIDIEVTESLLMDDVEHSTYLLERLRALGCRVAIDDFGTGYSSLNYLARLPADEIKIDKSFISLLAHSPETMGLVTNIITLAHSLSLQVVAEGVEEEEQSKLLRLLRCDAVQGYLFGMPLTAEEFSARFFN
jgi:PAS domain S-box-containing protein/diguanylate cyclase (GGDEF)-like protein